jgi:catalase
VPLKVIGRMVLDRWPDNFFAETEQVAYCPGNIVPGIDFSNDPLLQGRLFSYIDTQLSRLGSPNFHQIPINAPKCPFGNLQRDGHMQMAQPGGPCCYEPNSLSENSPRETPAKGFHSAAVTENGEKGRIRAESFADHYSQARQFYLSQTAYEQAHIASALVFELSKVEHVHVREAMVGHLRHIDEDLAGRVAKGLALEKMPDAPEAAAPVQELEPSPALQLIGKMKDTLKGRAIGILIADGSEGAVIKKIKKAATDAGAAVKIVAPKVGGAKLADGRCCRLTDNWRVCLPFFRCRRRHPLRRRRKNTVDGKRRDRFRARCFRSSQGNRRRQGRSGALEKANIGQDEGVVDANDKDKFIAAAKTRQWDREKSVRIKELVEHHIKDEESKVFKSAKKAFKKAELEDIMKKFEKDKEKIKKSLKK